MVKIRLARIGRKNLASFRVVVNPVRTKQNTHAIEELGFYSPHTKEYKFNNERVTYWLSVGAQPSETVRRLLVKSGVIKASAADKKFANKPGKKVTERRTAAQEAEAAKVAAAAKAEAEAKAAEEAAKLAAETPVEEVVAEVAETPAEIEAA